MAPRTAVTTQTDLTRAFKAAQKAGLKIDKIELKPDGSVLYFDNGQRATIAPSPHDAAHNEWDDVK